MQEPNQIQTPIAELALWENKEDKDNHHDGSNNTKKINHINKIHILFSPSPVYHKYKNSGSNSANAKSKPYVLLGNHLFSSNSDNAVCREPAAKRIPSNEFATASAMLPALPITVAITPAANQAAAIVTKKSARTLRWSGLNAFIKTILTLNEEGMSRTDLYNGGVGNTVVKDEIL